MAMPVRETLSPLARIHEEIDRMFQEFPMPSFWRAGEFAWTPRVDMYEQDNNLIIEAELPGVPKENVRVSCSDNTLTIEGETKKEAEEKRAGYYRAERHYGSFCRAISLPREVDFDKAKAEYRDGILRITLPEVTPSQKAKTIPISG